MCDRHNRKPLDQYCLLHEEWVCAQCATEDHAQSPCESMRLSDASPHVAAKLEVGMAELKKLKGVSQSILDGRRHDETLRTVQEAEVLLDQYADTIKRKLAKARQRLRPFSELSREERWKLKSVATKKLPTGPPVRETPDSTDVRDLATRLKEVRKQTTAAREILDTLPNYVEVTINKDFIDALKFDDNPVLISRKGKIEENDDLDDAATTVTLAQETVYIIEKSHFSLDHCTDIVIMDDYIIASVGDSVQKRDLKRMSFRQALTIPGAAELCRIGETTEVSVLQRHGYVILLETIPNLTMMYKLATDRHYHDISYLETTTGSRGCPENSPVFVVCYTNQEAFSSDFVDLIQAKPTRYPGNKLPSYNVKSRTIADSAFGRNKSRFRGVRTVSAFQGRNIVVGAEKGVTCISKTGVLIWTIDIYKQITFIMTYRTLIFVCVKGERKILTVGKIGHVIDENILPPMDMVPHKLAAHNDLLMVKFSGRYTWIIFKMMSEIVDT